MFKFIANFPRRIKILIILIIDLISIIFSLEASFSSRLGIIYVPSNEILLIYLIAVIVGFPIFYFFGLYSSVLKYINFNFLWTILKSTSLYTLTLGILIYFSGIEGIPRSIILINICFLTLCIIFSRGFANWVIYGPSFRSIFKKDSKKTKIVILGVNDSSVQLSYSLKNETEFEIFCFIDDTKKFSGQNINNIKVYKLKDLEKIIYNNRVSKLLISKSNLLKDNQNIIRPLLQNYPITIQEIPALNDLANNINIQDFKSINIEELLNRDVIKPDLQLINKNIKDKIVMITGAGGSIGSEISKQVIKIQPDKILLLDHSEYALYKVIEEVNLIKYNLKLKTQIVPILKSVTHNENLKNIFKTHNVDTIYHSAAYKHVSMLEFNIVEGVRNNILGTLNCARAAINYNVKNFVLISTDKAVRPTSIMGFSKRIAELVILSLDRKQKNSNKKTRFAIVRFGNVIGSSGSAIPLFSKQIEAGGPVTVTDPNVIRYFMTVKEAAELVIQAAAMKKNGDVYYLDMGEQIKILDLVKKMIHLNGKSVYDESTKKGDIKIKFIGLKKGEKLYEELTINDEKNKTDHPRIYEFSEGKINMNEVEKKLSYLENNINIDSPDQIIKELAVLVPEFKIDK